MTTTANNAKSVFRNQSSPFPGRNSSNNNTCEIVATFRTIKHTFTNNNDPSGSIIIAEAAYNPADNPQNNPASGQSNSASGGDPALSVLLGIITIKGQSSNELTAGSLYRFHGRWADYKNKYSGKTEKQFHYDSFVEVAPATREGIIAYLAKNGEGFGIGKQRAIQLYKAFAADAVKVCREDPARAAAAVIGWDEMNAKLLAQQLREKQHLEACSIELNALLLNRGMPRHATQAAIKLWGNRAAAVIRQDPFKLMAIKGCGFLRCDKMWLDFGLPRDRLKRQALCAWFALASESDGHIWFDVEYVAKYLQDRISNANVRKALLLAKRAWLLAFRRTDMMGQRIIEKGGKLLVAEAVRDRTEQRIVNCLIEAETESFSNDSAITTPWPGVTVETIANITDHQRAALSLATTSRIGILGGSPGTGKTFTAAELMKQILKSFGPETIAICAPTGKAAVRITESMEACGVSGITAKTIHSTLQIDITTISASGGGGWKFLYNKSNPLPHKFIIVDESSMIDASLMASLLEARAAGSCLLLIGDVNQLPPVGYGAPLRDMIQSKIAYGELTEIKRNSGGIVESCRNIRIGKPIESGSNLEIINGNFDSQLMLETIEDLLLNRFKAMGFDPVWDCQIIVPINTRSLISRKLMNDGLQMFLNPYGGEKNAGQLLIGDKVVNTKNGWVKLHPAFDHCQPKAITDTTNQQGEVYIANGEQGEVLQVAEKSVAVRMSISGAVVMAAKAKQPKPSIGEAAKAKRKADDKADAPENDNDSGQGGDGIGGGNDDSGQGSSGCNFELAYAVSCHKAQGAEWPVVIILADPSGAAARVCDKSWWYTAISRAKKHCVIIGSESVIAKHCRKSNVGNRRTLLVLRMERVRCERMLELI